MILGIAVTYWEALEVVGMVDDLYQKTGERYQRRLCPLYRGMMYDSNRTGNLKNNRNPASGGAGTASVCDLKRAVCAGRYRAEAAFMKA